ncbi:DNA adenine methylase [candidate division KSB1 bacterium]|nr:DNA adenine methylase [candidate division KSB1 bacterium]
MPITQSPLRYPGGKTKLFPFVKEIIELNQLFDGHYVEPYAGGGGLALSLLFSGKTRYIHLNDLDVSIYAFWHSVLYSTEQLCRAIEKVKIDMNEWEKQKVIQNKKSESDLFELGFSTLFLNRTNRSGIITGGVIGGKNQNGKYKIDARFNKKDLIRKIQIAHFYRHRISISNLDAMDFIKNAGTSLPNKTLVYLDPPYYDKGQELYQNFYSQQDHDAIANAIPKLKPFWILTYDNIKPIKDLYSQFTLIEYSLSYTAQNRYAGQEIFIADPRLTLPAEERLFAS